MQRRSINRIWLILAMFILSMSVGGAALAQADPSGTPPGTPSATPPTVEELQAQIAEMQARIDELETENEQLKQRITDITSGQQGGQQGASTPPAGTTYAIGETYNDGTWEITVTGYEFTPTISTSFETNTARGVYVLVYFNLTNVGTDPAEFPYDDLQLTSSDGRTYLTDWDTLFNLVYVVYENGSPTDPMQPGLPYTTAVAFDIPPTATGLSLTTSNKAFVFDLGV